MTLDKPLTGEEFAQTVGAIVNASMDEQKTIDNEKLIPLLLNLLCDQMVAVSNKLAEADKPRIITL